MADPSDLPEPDATEGVPHPRLAGRLFGHAAARAEFVAARDEGRMHHAWLLAGPPGVGKATFAWAAAGGLLAPPEARLPPDGFAADPDAPLRRRMAALSEPRLLLVRRIATEKGDQIETQLTGRALHKLGAFLRLSAVDGGWRVVIVDPVDEMNPTAANALLKVLEEPPASTVFLLVSHRPQRLLPTIRSRCRSLRFGPLAPQDLAAALEQAGVAPPPDPALSGLAAGSAGAAVRLIRLGGLDLWAQLVALVQGAPGLDRPQAIRLAEGFSGRANEPRLDLFLTLIEELLGRLARAGAGAPLPAYLAGLRHLAPGGAAALAWAEAAAGLTARARRGKALNLDPASLILDTLLRIDETAARIAPASRPEPDRART